jgi:hypothetical protein
MDQPTCDLCARLVDGTAYVCSPCADRVRDDLLHLAELAGEVEAAVLKLVRYGSGGGGSGERPVPWDDVRAERAAAVGNTVSTWARHISESRGVPISMPGTPRIVGPACYHGQALPLLNPAKPSCPHGSCQEIGTRRSHLGVQVAATWLAEHGQLEWLRHQREAAEAMSDLREAAREVERIVDRPRDRWYAGACWSELDELDENDEPFRCQEDLYAAPGTKTVRCRECGAEHDAGTRKRVAAREARDTLVHAELMARALTALGIEDVTPARVRGMARHGRLVAKGLNAAGDPTYRVGDVLDVIEEQERIEAERVRRREEKIAKRAERESAA